MRYALGFLCGMGVQTVIAGYWMHHSATWYGIALFGLLVGTVAFVLGCCFGANRPATVDVLPPEYERVVFGPASERRVPN